ncbi:MAG: hypothetical protein U9R17_01195 [Thermodesulfobacteriota bacterium]|nr:hypothetical protein [Thermodesulfobacteriota bacterium]
MNKSQNTYSDYEERTILFNEALEEIIFDFTDKYAEINIYFFDIFSLLEDVVYNPDTYGFAKGSLKNNFTFQPPMHPA